MNKNKVKLFQMLKFVHQLKPAYLPIIIINYLLGSMIPFISMILGARILDGIVKKEEESIILPIALIMVGSILGLTLLRNVLDKILIVERREIDDVMSAQLAKKSLMMDYQVLEQTETLNKLKKGVEGSNSHGGITTFCTVIGECLGQIITLIYSMVLLVQFIRTKGISDDQGILMRFVNSYWSGIIMLVLIMIVIFYNLLVFKKINELQYVFFESNVQGNREFGYFNTFIQEYKLGKQVRIYDMAEFLLGRMNDRKGKLAVGNVKLAKKTAWLASQGQMLTAVLLFISYLFVGLKAVSGAISIGMLSMYVAALSSFTQAFMQLCWSYMEIQVKCQYLSHYSDYLEIPNVKYDGTLPIEKRLDNDYELEFCDVSFHYPNNDQMVLNHISEKLKVGKKMAIVGLNGSGKSTFIKLLCRLYDPTEGEIRLNGIDIRKYDYDEYRNIFGVVFQDFQLFSFSVAQNVAAGVNYDEKKVWQCLDQAGMKNRVQAMEHGVESIIYKNGDEGVEISGGEAQKIAIARALYKDAPVVILDEPTAALDPVSEQEIYEKFDEMVEEKTAIYISHRMSSCRFCENIVVFDQGQIVQTGSHEQLVHQDGLYQSLWNAQSQYYA